MYACSLLPFSIIARVCQDDENEFGSGEVIKMAQYKKRKKMLFDCKHKGALVHAHIGTNKPCLLL